MNDKTCGPGEFLQIADFASREECATWASQMHAQRDRWTKSFGRYDWTFGNAFYVLLEQGEIHRYHAQADEKNALLASLTGYVDRMRSAADLLEVPAAAGAPGQGSLPTIARHERLGPYWCHSGIHIAGRNRGGAKHADFEGLAPYPELLFDPATRAYSVMLSIQRPRFGGGLQIWPERLSGGHDDADWERHLQQQPQALEYPVGALTIIDSFLVHRIQPSFTWGRQYRMVGVMHFLYREQPEPHWEYWF